MQCIHCGSPATYHLTDVRENRPRELHLCERCAWEKEGISSVDAIDPNGYTATAWRLQDWSHWRPSMG